MFKLSTYYCNQVKHHYFAVIVIGKTLLQSVHLTVSVEHHYDQRNIATISNSVQRYYDE